MEVIDKTYKTYTKLSRYNNFTYYYQSNDKKYIYGITSRLNDKTSYTNYLVKKNDTLDTLALYYYNNPTYFWIIADFNRISDPYKKLDENTYIKIPSFSSISFENI